MRGLMALVVLLIFPMAAWAEDRLVRLYAPAALADTGVIDHFRPRFTLKTQVRIEEVSAPEAADFVLGAEGRAVFDGLGQTWAVSVQDTPATQKLLDWMTSEVGQRTILGFAPDGVAIFTAPTVQAKARETVEMDGAAIAGHAVSRAKCARCHAVDEATRKTTIGSTPSFHVLKIFPDWEERFTAFYILKPHGAFTQIEGVTDPFPPERPSPISPVTLTIDELDAIVAYMAALAPADLGKPLESK